MSETPETAPERKGSRGRKHPDRPNGYLSEEVRENAHKVPPYRENWRDMAKRLDVALPTIYRTLQDLRQQGKVPAFKTWSALKAEGAGNTTPVRQHGVSKPKTEEATPEIPDELLERAKRGELTLEDLNTRLDLLILTAPHATQARAIEIKTANLNTKGDSWGPPMPASEEIADGYLLQQLEVLPPERWQRLVDRSRAIVFAPKEAPAHETQESEVGEAPIPDAGIGEVA